MPKASVTKGSNKFLSGVLVLTLSTVIVKIIGLVYKIPMLTLLGGEGMGYFNSAYEIYALVCTISVTGLPVAMSVIISSSDEKKRRKMFSLSLALFLVMGVAFFILMLSLSGKISQLLKNPKAALSIMAISPAAVFSCLLGVYRGYFQGRSKMLPISLSQIIEATGKLVLGIIFAYAKKMQGGNTASVAAAGILGVTLSSLLSFCFLFIFKLAEGKKTRIDKIDTRGENVRMLRELLFLALPITLSSLIVSLTRVVDMTMILRRLQYIGYSCDSANFLYGSYTTMCLPLFALSPALISAIAMPLIPSLSENIVQNDKDGQKKYISDALSLTFFIAMPISIGMCLFSGEILSLLFSGQGVAVSLMKIPLCILSLSVTLSCIITLTNGILQSYRRVYIPIISMSLGCIVKLVLSYVLIGAPSVNILGAPISTLACDALISAINIHYMKKSLQKNISVSRILAKPLICAAISVGVAYGVMKILTLHIENSRLLTLICIAIAGVSYLLLAGKEILKIKN